MARWRGGSTRKRLTPRPFAWMKTAEEILNPLAQYLPGISLTSVKEDPVRGQRRSS